MMPARTITFRAGLVAAAASALAVLGAAPAFAHVTVHPSHAAEGSYTKLTFRVPCEENNATTTRLQVTFPADEPIPSVSVQPHPGWTYTVDKKALAQPLHTDDGTVDQVVSSITWTANSPATAIKPGEFDEFAVAAGPLPTTAITLHFPALQTYSDGDIVRWIETAAPGAPEPQHPAPSLQLAAATSGTGAAASDHDNDTTALVLSIAALVIALGAAGGTCYLIARKRP